MKRRLPLILATAALVISLLGSTSLGQAARSTIGAVPYANVAGYAKNAAKLSGHRASTKPTAGQIPIVGSNGKLSDSIGAVGPKGDAGPQGPPGATGYQRIQQSVSAPSGEDEAKTYTLQCPGGKSVLAGGFSLSKNGANDLRVIESIPQSNSVWQVRIANFTGQPPKGATTLYAVCANVTS